MLSGGVHKNRYYVHVRSLSFADDGRLLVVSNVMGIYMGI